MTPDLPFRLAPHERQGEVWGKLQRHLTARLAELRQRNDGDLTPEQTALLRGRIAELKATLDVATDLPITPPGL